jgi:hypothetical protein
MTDPTRRPSDLEDPSQFARECSAKVRELCWEDIWRIDAEHFPSGGGRRDQSPLVQNLWFRRPLDPTTVPATLAEGRGSSRRRWPVGLAVFAGFALVVAGLIVALWDGGSETLGVRNERDKGSFLSRLSALVPGNSRVANPPVPRLITAAASGALRSNEAAPIGLTVDGAADAAQLLIDGFAPGSLFSVGQPMGQNTWRIPASQIEAATIRAPQGFVGSMELVVTLVLTNGSPVDRRALHLLWRPPTSASRPSGMFSSRIDAQELDELLAHGKALEATGDIGGARLVFQRAAEAGNAQAAFMLAETYDPAVLENQREVGLVPDVKAARIWYGRAKELGSEEALHRLQRLAHRLD